MSDLNELVVNPLPLPIISNLSPQDSINNNIQSTPVVEFENASTPIISDSILTSTTTTTTSTIQPLEPIEQVIIPSVPAEVVEPETTTTIVSEKPIVSEEIVEEEKVDLDNVIGAGIAIDGNMDIEMSEALEPSTSLPLSNGNGIVEPVQETLLSPVTPAEALSIAQSIPIEQLPLVSPATILESIPAVSVESVPVVSAPPAPIGAPEILPPPPVLPLPTFEQSLPQPPPPAFERMDSISSVVVEPPTPAASSSIPSSIPIPTPSFINNLTPSIQTPVSLPSPVAVTPPVLASVVSMDQDVVMQEDTVMGEISDSSLNKRSAPLEEEGQGEAKRARVDSEPFPFASTSASISPPIATASIISPNPYALYPTPVAQAFTSLPPTPPVASTSASILPYPSAEISAPTYVPQQLEYQQPPQVAIPVVTGYGEVPVVAAPVSLAAAPIVPVVPVAEGPIAVLNKEQHKWALSLVRGLKKNRQAPPFLKPVDPVALLIPDYFRVVTRPMDLGTVETKLVNTGKAMGIASKQGRIYGLDYNPGSGLWEGSVGCGEVYRTVQEYKEDVARVWENCFKYNGPKDKNPVSAMAGALQEVAEKAFMNAPYAPAIEYNPPPPVVAAPVVVPAPYIKAEVRRQSVSHSSRPSIDSVRPKRETQAPARIADTEEGGSSSKPARTGKVSGKTAHEQLKFCKEVIKELFKKHHAAFAFVFYEPVDYINLNIPQYPSIVKKPIDLGTIRTKLEAGQYPVPPFPAFEADMRLLFKNCYLFNPPGTPVHEWGKLLEGVFENKWEERPMVAEYEDESDDEHLHDLERQVVALQATIAQIKNNKRVEKESRKAAEKLARPPKAPKAPKHSNHSESSSKHHGNNHHNNPNKSVSKRGRGSSSGIGSGNGVGAGRKKKNQKKDEWDSAEDEDHATGHNKSSKSQEVTFDMKRELAVKIVSFEGDALEKAIDIIRRGRPELLGDANKEIELDIDQLDQSTLLALYRYVCPAPKKVSNNKKGRASNPTGAPKRKSMDEMKESERIRDLEARLREFEGNGNSGGGDSRRGSTAANGGADQASSDSSSEGESDSDSEED